MERIVINLKECSYPITVSSGLFNDPSSFFPLKEGDQVMIITNKTIAPKYLSKVLNVLKMAKIKADSVILPDGEQYKSMMTLNKIFTTLLKKLHGRDTTLIALGGGVIGDLTGFTAANYQRGVRFIQMPTSLLSQVDSSIGGKTAINHPLGKNMIGAFHQPSSVIIDLDCLKTLPIREFVSGLAEVIKYAISLDRDFFYWLEENMDALLRLDENILKYCILHCCKLKSNIVAIDEREIGLRTLLNLGHTYGHAIEVGMGYKNWLHGEAVSAGIVMSARTSEQLGQFKTEETNRIITLLKRVGLPILGPCEMSAQMYLFHMMRDKKALAGKLRLVLPLAIGKSKVQTGISKNTVLSVISNSQKHRI